MGSPARTPDAQTNWLSRFLHIRPASKILCFQVGRGKAKHDMVKLLRDWQRFGVRDVRYDQETRNNIHARVDKNNRKYIPAPLFRPWSFEGHDFSPSFQQLHYLFWFGTLILKLCHRSENQARLSRHRGLHRPRAWPSRRPLHCTLHSD